MSILLFCSRGGQGIFDRLGGRSADGFPVLGLRPVGEAGLLAILPELRQHRGGQGGFVGHRHGLGIGRQGVHQPIGDIAFFIAHIALHRPGRFGAVGLRGFGQRGFDRRGGLEFVDDDIGRGWLRVDGDLTVPVGIHVIGFLLVQHAGNRKMHIGKFG